MGKCMVEEFLWCWGGDEITGSGVVVVGGGVGDRGARCGGGGGMFATKG